MTYTKKPADGQHDPARAPTYPSEIPPMPAPHTPKLTPFHLAFNVRDLDKARAFYCGVLGAREGRSTDTWLDIDLFGHQLSMHIGEPCVTKNTGRVGDHLVPMPHLGVALELDTFYAIAEKLTSAGVDFVLPPTVRFAGQPGEQHTMFLCDPSGNAIEIKGFADLGSIFAR